MTEWQETTLSEVCERVDYGYTASASDDPDLPRFLRITDIVGTHIDWSTVPGCPIDDRGFEKYVLRSGDIVVARTGATVGHAKRIRQHPAAVFASYLVRFRPRPEVNPSFLGAIIESQPYKEYVLLNAGGAAQPNASAKVLGAFPLLLPDSETQGRVAIVFDALDELIENNRRRIELLEQMAQAIYREWFVRFRYPGHEDDDLVDSDLGPIPEGWEVRAVGDLVTVDKGLSYKGAFLTDEGVPMANLKCFRPGGGFRRDGTKPYSGPFKSKHEIKPGDLIVANTDLTQAGSVIGSPAFVPRKGFETGGIISHHLFAVRCADQSLLPWLFHVLDDHRFRDYARGVASGTTVLGFRPADLLSYRVACPPHGLMADFGAIVSDGSRVAEDLNDSSDALVAIRDLLLPKLVTGKIDVSELDLDALVEVAGA